MFTAKLLQCLESAHARQIEVQQYQINVRYTSRELKAARAIRRLQCFHRWSKFDDDAGHGIAHQRMVIDDEDFHEPQSTPAQPAVRLPLRASP